MTTHQPPGPRSPHHPDRRRPLAVHRADAGGRALLTLAGEIDLDTAPLVRGALAQCRYDGVRAIDVDLAPVTFCDCSGLNAFLEASRLTRAAGGMLRLRHPSPMVARLFALTGTEVLLYGAPDGTPAPGPRTASAA